MKNKVIWEEKKMEERKERKEKNQEPGHRILKVGK